MSAIDSKTVRNITLWGSLSSADLNSRTPRKKRLQRISKAHPAALGDH